MVDGAAVAAEVGLHQRSLLLALFGAASPGPPVHVGLDHQGLLPLLLLLLLQQRSLSGEEHTDEDTAREGTSSCCCKNPFGFGSGQTGRSRIYSY